MKTTALLLVTILLMGTAFAQWEKIHIAGAIPRIYRCAVTSSGKIFAASGNSIYRSTDNGLTWQKVFYSNTFNPFSLQLIKEHQGIFYFPQNKGIWKSTDGGLTWNIIPIPQVTGYFEQLELDKSGNIYMSERYGSSYPEKGKIWKSTDGGMTWTQKVNTLNNNYITSLTADTAGNIFSSVFLSDITSDLFKTTNGGNSWNFVSHLPNSVNSLKIDNRNIFYFNSYGRKLYRSSNAGINWHIISTNCQTFDIDKNHGIYALTCCTNILYSTDGGQNWSTNPLSLHNCFFMAVSYPKVYVATEKGLWSSSNFCDWSVCFQDTVSSVVVNDFAIYDSIMYTATEDGLFISSDNGLSWDSTFYGFSSKQLKKNVDGSLFVISNDRLYKSTNNGAFWLLSLERNPYTGITYYDFNEAGTLAAMSTDQSSTGSSIIIFKSLNNGNSWDTIYQYIPPLPYSDYGIVTTFTLGNQNIYFSEYWYINYTYGPYYYRLWKCTLSGQFKWVYSDIGVTDLIMSNDTMYVSYTFLGSSQGILVTTNGMLTHTQIFDKTTFHLARSKEGITFALVNDWSGYFLYYRYRDNYSFKFLSNLPENMYASKMVYCDNHLYLCTSAGLYKYDAVITGVEENTSNSSVTEFNLSQNYPNPFNPATEIKYRVAKPGLVSLTVYDMLGRKVSDLVNKFETPGNYSVTFDDSNYASGIYFYRLSAGEFVSTKKMILLK